VYNSPNNILEIKSKRKRSPGHAACMGERRVYTGVRGRNLGKRDHL
jgi:hypothetical protein